MVAQRFNSQCWHCIAFKGSSGCFVKHIVLHRAQCAGRMRTARSGGGGTLAGCRGLHAGCSVPPTRASSPPTFSTRFVTFQGSLPKSFPTSFSPTAHCRRPSSSTARRVPTRRKFQGEVRVEVRITCPPLHHRANPHPTRRFVLVLVRQRILEDVLGAGLLHAVGGRQTGSRPAQSPHTDCPRLDWG